MITFVVTTLYLGNRAWSWCLYLRFSSRLEYQHRSLNVGRQKTKPPFSLIPTDLPEDDENRGANSIRLLWSCPAMHAWHECGGGYELFSQTQLTRRTPSGCIHAHSLESVRLRTYVLTCSVDNLQYTVSTHGTLMVVLSVTYNCNYICTRVHSFVQ